jgi:type IV pilus assembly protein PilF
MKIYKTLLSYLSVLLVVLTITSCVTEVVTDTAFKKPTQEDLQRAMALYIQMAYKYLESKDYERAMSSAKRALDIDEDAPTALNILAIIYQSQGESDKARETFKKVLEEDDKYSDGHLSYGQFLLQQKEPEEACKQFQLAADDDFYAKRATAYFYLAACQKIRGDLAATELALTRCIGLDPNYAQAIGMFASIKFEKQQYAEAKELFDRHVKVVRTNKQQLSAEALWLGIQLERVFHNPDAEASWALYLKNKYPYSKEYLEYQKSLKK